jgi:2-polyprenyl-6-methoxyphenol hydroxylase-like FAD-dependent oxidoreductase
MRSHVGRVLVVGGGVGGTATGVALRQLGIDAVVFERAPDVRRIHVGGSYVLWYAGVSSLAQLGLADKVRGLGHEVTRFEMCDRRGRVLSSVDTGDRGRSLGAVPVAVRRADLLAVLGEALEPDALRLGTTFRDAVQDRRWVTATFTDGGQERGDVLVGADGLDSTVRAHLHGLAPASHPGYAHWSGVTDADGGVPPGVFRVLHHRGARFAYFHLGDGKLCWWCTRRAPEGPAGDALGSPEALLAAFGSWQPAVRAMLEATVPGSIHRRDTLDRPPLRRWGEGRITLLGDAAHAMTFNLGQGAGTSLTDAVTLAEHLASAPPLGALRSYERQRRSITTPLVRMSRLVGATSAWGGPVGGAANAAFLLAGRKSTPQLLERDLQGHPGRTSNAGTRAVAGSPTSSDASGR